MGARHCRTATGSAPDALRPTANERRSTMATAPVLESDAGLVIRPIQPTIGAEIDGVDLSRPLTRDLRDAIRAAVLRHKVVFFRDQVLDNDQHAAFAAEFGPLY